MRIFIAGSKAFGAAVFEMALARGHTIAGVSAPLYAATPATTAPIQLISGMSASTVSAPSCARIR